MILVIADRLSISPTLVQIRLWNYLETSIQSLSHHALVGRHGSSFLCDLLIERKQLLEDAPQVIAVHVGYVDFVNFRSL